MATLATLLAARNHPRLHRVCENWMRIGGQVWKVCVCRSPQTFLHYSRTQTRGVGLNSKRRTVKYNASGVSPSAVRGGIREFCQGQPLWGYQEIPFEKVHSSLDTGRYTARQDKFKSELSF